MSEGKAISALQKVLDEINELPNTNPECLYNQGIYIRTSAILWILDKNIRELQEQEETK